jgi:hypothetical protein
MSQQLFSQYQDPDFNSGVVRPFECLGAGWNLVKDQFVLFAVLSLVITILVTCIPFSGIIYGAWICGIYFGLLRKLRGEQASFNDCVVTGFSYFSGGFVIALLSGLPFVLLTVVAQVWEWHFDTVQKHYPGSEEIPPEVMTQELLFIGLLILAFILFHLITGLIFPFAYQLVVERNLSGWKAIKLSARASRENLGGVFGLVIIEIVLGLLGIALCCVGLILVMPLMKSAWTVAYRQVFPPPPEGESPPLLYPPPPPPPTPFGSYVG